MNISELDEAETFTQADIQWLPSLSSRDWDRAHPRRCAPTAESPAFGGTGKIDPLWNLASRSSWWLGKGTNHPLNCNFFLFESRFSQTRLKDLFDTYSAEQNMRHHFNPQFPYCFWWSYPTLSLWLTWIYTCRSCRLLVHLHFRFKLLFFCASQCWDLHFTVMVTAFQVGTDAAWIHLYLSIPVKTEYWPLGNICDITLICIACNIRPIRILMSYRLIKNLYTKWTPVKWTHMTCPAITTSLHQHHRWICLNLIGTSEPQNQVTLAVTTHGYKWAVQCFTLNISFWFKLHIGFVLLIIVDLVHFNLP